MTIVVAAFSCFALDSSRLTSYRKQVSIIFFPIILLNINCMDFSSIIFIYIMIGKLLFTIISMMRSMSESRELAIARPYVQTFRYKMFVLLCAHLCFHCGAII